MKTTYRLAKDIIMLALVMMLCCYTKSYSQYKQEIQATEKVKKNEIPRFSLIPKAGINAAIITFPEINGGGRLGTTETNIFRVGYHIGITGEMKLSHKLAIKIGLVLNNRGGNFNSTFNASSYDSAIGGISELIYKTKYFYNITYLDIPFDFKYYVYTKNSFRAFVNVGGYMGIRLFGMQTTTISVHDSDPRFNNTAFYSLIPKSPHGGADNSANIIDYFTRIDRGINIGAGVEYRNIIFSVNGQIGIADIFIDDDIAHRTTQDVLQISLGYRFGIGK